MKIWRSGTPSPGLSPWNFSHLSLYLQDKAVKVGVQFKYLTRDLNRELFFLSFSDVSRVISNTFQLWNEKICIPLIISEKLMLPCCMKTSLGAIVESSKYFPEKLQSQYWGPSFLFKCLSISSCRTSRSPEKYSKLTGWFRSPCRYYLGSYNSITNLSSGKKI